MRDFVKVVIRILALYFIFLSVLNFGSVTAALISMFFVKWSSQTALMNFSIMLNPIFMAVTGIIVWCLSDILAKLVVKNTGEVQNVSIDLELLQKAAITTVGIVMFAYSIPAVVSGVFSSIAAGGITNPSMRIRNTAAIIEAVIKLVIGIWLAVGSNGIAAIIKKLRNAGIQNQENDKSKTE